MLRDFFNMRALSTGLALFSMFFGAGNIIFPLAVGQYAGDKNFFAILGLVLTAAVMPIAGVMAMLLFDGNTRSFFGRLGKFPGFVLSFVVIALLGPFGSTPRCIALAYSTLSSSGAISLSPTLFSALSCLVIFACSLKKSRMLALLGYILSPLLILSLVALILCGLIIGPEALATTGSNSSHFLHGLKEGYNTMDLLAAFFFSATILGALRGNNHSHSGQNLFKTSAGAAMIGALLLAIIYVGFSYLAASYSPYLTGLDKDQLLTAITLRVGGPYAGLLICLISGLACLTTAIALIAAFADFAKKELFKERLSYKSTLAGSLIITFVVSTFQFNGISTFLGPILQICYPGLILLTFLNMAHRLKEIKTIKTPVFCTFSLAALAYFLF